MKITKYFAAGIVAVVLVADDSTMWTDRWQNDSVRITNYRENSSSDNRAKMFYLPFVEEKNDSCIILLYKYATDLYMLEWRKPTEQDIGKICWIYDGNTVSWNKLDFSKLLLINCFYTLVADHGQIAPTIKDFKQVYGETNEN